MNTAQQLDSVLILKVALITEGDVVAARQRARQLSEILRFDRQDQVRIATAVSEIARNAYRYAGGGAVEFSLTLARPQTMQILVSDSGPGIPNLEAILSGEYRSPSGLGVGLAGARRLMDTFSIDTAPRQGARVRLGKRLPPGAELAGMASVRSIAASMAGSRPAALSEELLDQNRDMLQTLEALRARELELERRTWDLSRLNAELEETNRGVVALYAELDEKALQLRRADELKGRFLSHVSHEFRTPLNAILALSQLLLRRTDGDLTEEQERQVGYIKKAAHELVEMVNDLLDLAKVESGKIEVTMAAFPVAQMFRVLRGVMRPLAINDAVSLIFDEPPTGLSIVSDESKIAQILRNLVSNALKFTERGHVRVSCVAAGSELRISVADTGIGIAPADQEIIFQEFTQVLNPLQRKVKGTGLGLPLSRKLAELLGGRLEVSSVPGEGSVFTLTVPAGIATEDTGHQRPECDAPRSVLIIDDEEPARYLARHLFRGSAFRVIEASDGTEGAERARFEHPALILLDLIMPGRSGFDVLNELKSDAATAAIPVVIHTSKELGQADLARLAGRHDAVLPKTGANRVGALLTMRTILADNSLFAGELEAASQRDEDS